MKVKEELGITGNFIMIKGYLEALKATIPEEVRALYDQRLLSYIEETFQEPLDEVQSQMVNLMKQSLFESPLRQKDE